MIRSTTEPSGLFADLTTIDENVKYIPKAHLGDDGDDSDISTRVIHRLSEGMGSAVRGLKLDARWGGEV